MSAPETKVWVLHPQEPEITDLEALYRRYSPYVAAIGLRLLGRDDEVDDLVQDVFLAAQRGIGSVRHPAAVRGWLATVAVRTARRRLRRRRLRTFVGIEAGIDYLNALPPRLAAPERALLAAVYAVLDHLPVAERLAWSLRHIEGESLARVASLCGCSLATAKRRIARAHTIIQEAVTDG